MPNHRQTKRRRKLPQNLYWNGPNIWARIKVQGREHRWSLRTDDVETAKARLEADRKRLLAGAYYGDARTTYEDAVVSWAENHIPDRGIGQNTAKRYAVSLQQLEPWLRGRFIDEVDDDLVGAIVKGRRQHDVTTATLRRDLTALSSILTHAEDEGWRRGNPALDRLRRLKERRDPIVLPNPAHVGRVVERAPGLFAAMIEAARATGCRQDELAKARRADLNHERRELTVIGKRNKLRVVDLDYAGGYDLLRAITPHVRGQHLFWHDNGKPYRNVSSRFAAIVRAEFCAAYDAVHGTTEKTRPAIKILLKAQDEPGWLDVGFRPFRFHDLRHLHAVEYLRAGHSIYDLRDRLGHESIKTTELYLAFLTPEQKRIAMLGAAQKAAQSAHRGRAS